MKKVFLLTLISAFFSLYGETTSSVAQKLGFFDFMTALRNKANDFLNTIERQRKAEIQRLRYRHHFGEAQEKGLDLQEEYRHLSNELDDRFEIIDRMIVLGGDHVDKVGAPLRTKEALVTAARERAQALIGNYIKTYHGQHRHR
jgi:hypothetical protein